MICGAHYELNENQYTLSITSYAVDKTLSQKLNCTQTELTICLRMMPNYTAQFFEWKYRHVRVHNRPEVGPTLAPALWPMYRRCLFVGGQPS